MFVVKKNNRWKQISRKLQRVTNQVQLSRWISPCLRTNSAILYFPLSSGLTQWKIINRFPLIQRKTSPLSGLFNRQSLHWEHREKRNHLFNGGVGHCARTCKWDVLMCMPPSGSTESKVVPPGSLTHGPSMDGKGSENWKSPKTPKSHYTKAYKGGIILSLSFKWPALAVTHIYHKQTTMS